MEQYRLIDALRLAGARRLGRGWLYPREGVISPDLECILVADDEEELDERGFVAAAVLDTDTLEAIFDCAKSFADQPSDDLLLESFTYYCEFDAFLPSPGFRPSL